MQHIMIKQICDGDASLCTKTNDRPLACRLRHKLKMIEKIPNSDHSSSVSADLKCICMRGIAMLPPHHALEEHKSPLPNSTLTIYKEIVQLMLDVAFLVSLVFPLYNIIIYKADRFPIIGAL